MNDNATKLAPPPHAFELRISIGGDDWKYILRTIRELADHIEGHGPDCALVSGGYGGSHSVHIQKRDVTPEQFHVELQEWFEISRESDRKATA